MGVRALGVFVGRVVLLGDGVKLLVADGRMVEVGGAGVLVQATGSEIPEAAGGSWELAGLVKPHP